MTSIEKTLERLLARSAGKFNHGKIQRFQVKSELESLKKYQEEFQINQEAYYMYGIDEGIEEEFLVVQEKEKLYNEVVDKFCQSLDLYADYEESYKIYKAALPDSDLTKNAA